MKRDDVKVGGTFTAKVNDRLVSVRIDSPHSKQGWNATNTATGKRIHIKNAQRLRSPVKPDKKKVAAVAPPSEIKRSAKTKPNATPKRLSALGAAVQVLRNRRILDPIQLPVEPQLLDVLDYFYVEFKKTGTEIPDRI